MNYNFWKDWKKKIKLEEKAIKVLLEGKRIILDNINKNEIISIYVKGSLLRRELNNESDVDILVILKSSSTLKKLKTLNKKYGKNYKPELQFSGYSLWELKTGKRTKRGVGTPPNRFSKHVKGFKLIYGSDLSKEKFFMPSDKKYLKNRIKFIRDNMIPKYKEGKYNFQDLLKQTFWLIESERFAKGENPPQGFKALKNSIKDRNHIVHNVYKLRIKPLKNKKTENIFVKKLKRYLKELK
jgi:predicted nucleotidyltransferase